MGDAGLTPFPILLVGSLDAVETTDSDFLCDDGPNFADGWSSGIPLAYINLLIKPSFEEGDATGDASVGERIGPGDANGGERSGPGAAPCRPGTVLPFA